VSGISRLGSSQAHGDGTTANAVLNYLSREFGMTVRPNHLGIALQRHRRAGRLDDLRKESRFEHGTGQRLIDHRRRAAAHGDHQLAASRSLWLPVGLSSEAV
jgi:hypothetical protein